MIAAALLYGSWIPFDLDLSRLSVVTHRTIPPLGFPSSDLEDLLVNLLVYMPLGAAITLRGWGSTTGRRAFVWRAALLGALVSFAAELVQTLSALRMASWIDVAVNTLGATLGALMAPALLLVLGRGALRMRQAFSSAPLMALALVMSLLWMLISLAPFDFVPNTVELHDRFLAANWQMAGALPSDAWGMLATLARYAPLMIACGCLALARMRGGWARVDALFSAAKHAFLLGAVVEVIQIFVVSQSFELAGVPEACLVGAVGAALTVIATRVEGQAWATKPLRLNRAFMPTLVLLAIAGVGVAAEGVLTAGESRVLQFPAMPRFLPPFEAVWRLSTVHALGELAGMVAIQGVWALLLMALLGGRRSARMPILLMIAAASVSLASQAWRGVGPAGMDLTAPVVALAIAAGLTRIYVNLRPPVPAQRHA
ncbi:MAG: VanZ family protein [Phycisphaerales bacterium]|nr:VanZ family protein [Phycisphaerales bacterium]